jgi:hypothetical protein
MNDIFQRQKRPLGPASFAALSTVRWFRLAALGVVGSLLVTSRAWWFEEGAPQLLRAAPVGDDSPAGELEEGFEPLFDGVTLDGWEGEAEWFRVEESAVVAGRLTERIPHNFFLCTHREFGDFELRLEVRSLGPGDNGGIQFRSQRVAGTHEVSGYQADVGSVGSTMIWGALYDESRRNRMLVQPPDTELRAIVSAPGEWNRMRIRAEGERIQIWVNDQLTVDYAESDADVPRRGLIGLQVHSGPPAEIWYRRIQIQQL